MSLLDLLGFATSARKDPEQAAQQYNASGPFQRLAGIMPWPSVWCEHRIGAQLAEHFRALAFFLAYADVIGERFFGADPFPALSLF